MEKKIFEVSLDYAVKLAITMQEWENKHWKSVLEELKQEGIPLTLKNTSEIINRMSFKVRSQKYPDKCPYYLTKKSCHPKVRDLNCLLCSCPNYDSFFMQEKNNKSFVGKCRINNKHGFYYFSKDFTSVSVWDCSDCTMYHSPESVKNYLRKHLDDLTGL